ncbi:MAG: hypothetical protein K2J37_03745, partial [Ruminococcus sp.]|nr:hypothetical protein [Ruminococcus sp.]
MNYGKTALAAAVMIMLSACGRQEIPEVLDRVPVTEAAESEVSVESENPAVTVEPTETPEETSAESSASSTGTT